MNITLDNYHNNKLKKLDIEKNININNKKIKKLEEQIKKLDEIQDFNKTNEDIDLKYSLILQKNNLENENIKLKNNNPKVTYLLDTMEILEKYYINQDNNNDEEITIMDYINNKKNNQNNIKKFVKGEKKTLRKQIFFDYLDLVDKSNKKGRIQYVKNYTYCDNCNIEKTIIYHESLYVCEKCGQCDPIIVDSEKTSYKDNLLETTNFSYKRYNHFIEWLNQFQANETISIPMHVYEKIKDEIKKEKLNIKQLDNKKIRSILKKINESKYYENTNHILNKLNNKPAPKFSKNVEDRLKIMFKKCQEPFNKVCPLERKNFLSYSYIIRKFLELLDEKKYIEYFPLLKSREKLYEQDLIWKNMCNILNWEFIPSI